MGFKSGSIITEVVKGKQVVKKINGQYFMYWGENNVCAATSDNLIDWTPIVDAKAPTRFITYLAEPFFRPMDSFEKSGQYRDGTVFIEGMVLFKGKWYLYYDCADSEVGVAVYNPKKPATPDPLP